MGREHFSFSQHQSPHSPKCIHSHRSFPEVPFQLSHVCTYPVAEGTVLICHCSSFPPSDGRSSIFHVSTHASRSFLKGPWDVPCRCVVIPRSAIPLPLIRSELFLENDAVDKEPKRHLVTCPCLQKQQREPGGKGALTIRGRSLTPKSRKGRAQQNELFHPQKEGKGGLRKISKIVPHVDVCGALVKVYFYFSIK